MPLGLWKARLVGKGAVRCSREPATTSLYSACGGMDERIYVSLVGAVVGRMEAGVTLCCEELCIHRGDAGMLGSRTGQIAVSRAALR